MEVTRSSKGDPLSFSDFYYAFTCKDSSENCINYYHFKDEVFKDLGSQSFYSFVKKIQDGANILDLGKSVINLQKVIALEILPPTSSFKFYFEDLREFVCEAPDGLKDTVKFCALAQIIMDAFMEVEKNRNRNNGDYSRETKQQSPSLNLKYH
jgi:hypothetical protein